MIDKSTRFQIPQKYWDTLLLFMVAFTHGILYFTLMNYLDDSFYKLQLNTQSFTCLDRSGKSNNFCEDQTPYLENATYCSDILAHFLKDKIQTNIELSKFSMLGNEIFFTAVFFIIGGMLIHDLTILHSKKKNFFWHRLL